MKIIWNMTALRATSGQRQAGVVDLPDDLREVVTDLLTFNDIPTPAFVQHRATALAVMAKNLGAERVMVRAEPFMLPALEQALKARGITAHYAFSERVHREVVMPDGHAAPAEDTETHLGFYPRVA